MVDPAWSSTIWASVGDRVLCWMETSIFIQRKPKSEAGRPLARYDTVEIGVSRFLHPWEQDHGVVGEAKFMHVRQHKDRTGEGHTSDDQ